MGVATRVFQQGETAIIRALVRDGDGALITADTSVEVVINDPQGTEVQASTAMGEGLTGNYTFAYGIGAAAVLGEWDYEVVVIHGSRTTIQQGTFAVKARST